MEKLRDEMVLSGLDPAKLDEITKNVESKEIYKVYILYEFLEWENSRVEEKYVLYTEDESLAHTYFNLLHEVEEALDSRCDEFLPCYFTTKLEKVSMQNYRTGLTVRKED